MFKEIEWLPIAAVTASQILQNEDSFVYYTRYNNTGNPENNFGHYVSVN